MTSVSTHTNGTPTVGSKPNVSAAKVMPASSTETYLLVNAAFLKEIKDSNPNLWHAAHELRSLCEGVFDDPDATPQVKIRDFVQRLDELRDLVSLQFALEESYGYLQIEIPPSGLGIPDQARDPDWQTLIRRALTQHSRLYLVLADLVEQAEELQYRGCDRTCVSHFADKVAEFTRDLSRHERLEAELASQAN